MVLARERTEGSGRAFESDEEEEEMEGEDSEDEEQSSASAADSRNDDDVPKLRNRSRAPSPASSAASELARAVEKLDLTAPLPPPLSNGVLPATEDVDLDGDLTAKLSTIPPAESSSITSEAANFVLVIPDAVPAAVPATVRDIVAADLIKKQRRQQAKYHSKKGGVGRSRGSKAKQDTRVDLDKGGYWE